MRKLLFVLAACAAFLLPAGAHAFCYGVTPGLTPPPDGTVCGTVVHVGYSGSYFYAKPDSLSYVKICPAGSSPSSFNCTTSNTGSFLDAYNHPVQAFMFPHYRQGAPSSLPYDLYAWGYYNDFWGSSTKPIQRIYVDQYGLEGVTLNMPPSPLSPTPIYPSGNSVGSSYTVTWNSGIDTDRSAYPVNYEVWYKYWPFGGTEPTSWTLSRANMPCQDTGAGPDASNHCSTYVAGPQPSGNWAWRVVANLNVSSWDYYANTFFTTTSNALYFTEP